MRSYLRTGKKKMATIILAALLGIAVIGLILWAAFDWPETVTMNAAMISADGTAGSPFALTVEWPSGYPKNETDDFALRISDTKDFPYVLDWEGKNVNTRPEWDYPVFRGLVYSLDDNSYISADLTVDVEMGLLILSLPEKNTCFVASKEANVTAQQILDHFLRFVADDVEY